MEAFFNSLNSLRVLVSQLEIDHGSFKSSDLSFIVSDLDVVSVDDDSLLNSDGLDILESFDMFLSRVSNLSVKLGSLRSHSSDTSESSEVSFEDSLATLSLWVLETNLNFAI